VEDELPHSIMVEEMGLREGRPADQPLLDMDASMIVERDSQKGIMIGHPGSRLCEIGAAARHQIEALLGTSVYLDLRVKVRKERRRDPQHLNRLGFWLPAISGRTLATSGYSRAALRHAIMPCKTLPVSAQR
jgi:GTP-binding protein Era